MMKYHPLPHITGILLGIIRLLNFYTQNIQILGIQLLSILADIHLTNTII